MWRRVYCCNVVRTHSAPKKGIFLRGDIYCFWTACLRHDSHYEGFIHCLIVIFFFWLKPRVADVPPSDENTKHHGTESHPGWQYTFNSFSLWFYIVIKRVIWICFLYYNVTVVVCGWLTIESKRNDTITIWCCLFVKEL